MFYSDKQRNVYAINNVHVQFDWGVAASFKDVTNTICEKGTSTPLTFWIVGELATCFWFNEDGYPAKRVSVSVRPLSTDLPAFCKRLLQSLCMPRNSYAFGPEQVRATRWMTRRGQRGQPSATDEFSDFYDARTALRDKSVMQKLNVDQLVEHDIVLLEVQLGRYSSETNSDGKAKRKAFNKWQSFFDLQAIYLLKNAARE
ncbi:hypothetical protein B0H14DRAFT_2400901 [Mycena olivaceomarginata]|nr:hypothetical protein B0H14DRAFT_2400901 [Mycena olivaceomarginata]